MTAVSAVIPVYNGEEYIGEAIGSVLGQTHSPIECLVIDDGSTDATREVVGGFGDDVTYVRVPRGGQSRARNHGTWLARGELVAFLDHDDEWLPTKLERQIGLLRAHREAVLVLCAVEFVEEHGTRGGIRRFSQGPPEVVINKMVSFDNMEIPAVNSNALVRRDWLLDNGGYDPVLSVCGDWDLLLRTLLAGMPAYLDEPLVRYRVRESGLHRNIAVMERDMRYAFAKAFADVRLPATVRGRRRHAYGRMYRMLAGSYRDVGDRRAMARTAAIGMKHDPTLALEALKRPWRRPSST